MQTCTRCSRVSPGEAIYCWFDGYVLPDRVEVAAKLDAGKQPFSQPFVFPSGQTSGNIDQLILACLKDWPAAVELLHSGRIEAFFRQLGRADLAIIAQGATRLPNAELGLNELLGRLPNKILKPPQLHVDPADVSLGPMRVGRDGSFTVRLTNKGMCLIYGSVQTDCLWLSLDPKTVIKRKIVRFHEELTLSVHVLGHHLRSGLKPLEGQLTIATNGGNARVLVRVEVPPTVFAHGVLAGANTPRQLVEKTKQAPAEAAVWFEKGTVRDWFAENGWAYPVQGPIAAGMNAVRQFFQALGLSAEEALFPPRPFANGSLAGVRTPRELAEKMQANPKETAALVENGAIRSWYAENGWVYPVHGPIAIGMDALRQFCKAVGANDVPASSSREEKQRGTIRPFAQGCLAGVRTPRELVEKTRAGPSEAAAYFENGAVAAWYADNGWRYPVQGPLAAGLDAVRQFFKALGFADPSAIRPSPAKRLNNVVQFQGRVGDELWQETIIKAAVPLASARAVSDQAWLGVRETRVDHNAATILLEVPAVPDHPGKTLDAHVNVVLNDAHCFLIPVTLTVDGRAAAPESAGAAQVRPGIHV